MGGIGPGDVVVCVDDRACRCGCAGTPVSVVRGRHYRVEAVVQSIVHGIPLLVLVGVPAGPGHRRGTNASRFRKLDEDIGFDFREQLRAKPKTLETNSPRAEQPLGTSAGGSVPPFSAPASQHSSTRGVV